MEETVGIENGSSRIKVSASNERVSVGWLIIWILIVSKF